MLHLLNIEIKKEIKSFENSNYLKLFKNIFHHKNINNPQNIDQLNLYLVFFFASSLDKFIQEIISI